MSKFVCILTILCVSVLAQAQQRIYNFVHYTTADGLPGNIIRGIALDNDGLVWVTSSKGLSFFDGDRFQNVDFTKVNGLFSTDLGKIAIDKSGLIWIATGNQGLLCYDRKKPVNASLSHFSPVAPKTNFVKDELYDVMVAKSGLIYFGGQDTDLQVLDPASGKVKQISFNVKKRNSHLSIFSLAEDYKGNIWVGTRYDGFFCYNPKTKYLHQVNLNNKLENGVGGFAFFNNDVYVSYYDHDLVKFDPVTGRLQAHLLNEAKNVSFYDNAFNCLLYEERENQIIAGHNSKGLVRYDLNKNKYEKVSWATICPTCKEPFRINMLLNTPYGYWVCTSNGLFFYSTQNNIVNKLIERDDEPIVNIFKIDSAIWYQTDRFFGKLSADYTTKLSRISLQNLKVSQVNINQGTIYFSTFYKGLYSYNTKSNAAALSPLPIKGDNKGFESADCNRVFADTVDNKPILWIGTWNKGLYRYDVSNKRISCYDKDGGLPDNKIIALGKDKLGTLWLGMDGHGMVRLESKKNMTFHHYVRQQGNNSILANKIIAFLPECRDTIWYSSSSSGVGAIIKAENEYKFKNFPDKNEFPVSYVVDIQRDIFGRLWMKSMEGMTVFDPKTESFYPLLSGRGILPPPTHKTYGFYLNGEELIWYTDLGLVVGKLRDIRFEKQVNSVPLVTKFSVQNVDNSHRLHQRKSIRLKPYENNFTFSFTTADPSPLSYQYAYRLEGFDNKWITATKDLQAVYTNLNGGKYRFQVKVGDIHGNWSPTITSIDVHLASRWYQTMWFKLLGVLLIFVTLIAVFKYRLNQQKKINLLQLDFNRKMQAELITTGKKIIEQAEFLEFEKQEKLKSDFKKKLYESELKAIRSQMNPHFIFNVLNSIEAYVVENDAKSASKLIHKFAALSRTVLENSQFSIVTIASEVHLVKLYLDLEQERFDNNFTYEIAITNQQDLIHKKIPSMLIQPLVENAVHHGIRHLQDRKGKIVIQIYETNHQIYIHILDNGIGFNTDNPFKNVSFKPSSFGIKGIQERINMINSNHIDPIAFMNIMTQNVELGFSTKVSIILPSHSLDDYSDD